MVPAKPRIAHFAGSIVTGHSIPQPVTSNKARAKHGLASLADAEDARPRFDMLRPQRLARPVTVYIGQFSAHLLEADAAGLYACGKAIPMPRRAQHDPLQRRRPFLSTRSSYGWENNLCPLLHMARQANCRSRDMDEIDPGACVVESAGEGGV